MTKTGLLYPAGNKDTGGIESRITESPAGQGTCPSASFRSEGGGGGWARVPATSWAPPGASASSVASERDTGKGSTSKDILK